MMTFSRIVASTVGAGFIALGLATSAQADGYSEPRVAYERPFSWTGFYIGANAGWVDGNVDWKFHDPASGTILDCSIAGFPVSPCGIGQRTGIFGAHAGYQYQFAGGLVLGMEAAISFPGNDSFAGKDCFFVLRCESRTDYLATIGPRIGWGFSKFLVYGTGGYAHGQIDTQMTFVGVNLNLSTRSGNDGWFAGAGVEYAIHRNVILGVEYQHIALDTNVLARTTGSPSILDRNITGDYDIVRGRLSFKFDNEERRAVPLK